MNVLVTGGAGFIGSHLVDKLIEDNHKVRIFDNLENQVHGNVKPTYLNPKAEFLKGDMRNEEDLKKALEDIEVIFHHAAAVGIGQSMYEIKKYVEVNTLGTAKLLDLLVNKNYDIKKIIVASSMSIYGEGGYKCDDCGFVYPTLRNTKQLNSKEWELKCPNCKKIVKPISTSEDKPLCPTSIYAITKKDQEEMCLSIGRNYGIPTVALRYFNVYGPRQSLNNPYTGVCAIFSSRIKNNNSPIIYEDGLQSRDFISVHDIVQANILSLKKEANYETFNVGTGKVVTIQKISEVLSNLYNYNGKPKITNQFRKGDIRHCVSDISKIQNKLGFKPKISFEEGMKELVKWGEKVNALDKTNVANRELKEKGLI